MNFFQKVWNIEMKKLELLKEYWYVIVIVIFIVSVIYWIKTS
jgi:membrane protein DedA with SNARE-associated domain